MEHIDYETQIGTPAIKLPRYNTDLSHCIINKKLVDKPVSHEKVLNTSENGQNMKIMYGSTPVKQIIEWKHVVRA